jgi:catechol 1,2-dioxygenase
MHLWTSGKPPQTVSSSSPESDDNLADNDPGLYEQQDEKQIDHNLRGKFITDDKGEYSFYCLKPTPYPIPFDGPAGKLLQLLDRHPYRPAHIHLIVSGHSCLCILVLANAFKVMLDGYKPVTTQIFDKDSQYLEDDSVFAVKDSLTVEFVPRKGDKEAELELKYDIQLAHAGEPGDGNMPLVTNGIESGPK